MNKAFVREPDQGVERCPRCGSLGEPVGLDTVKEFLKPEFPDPLSDSAHFCPYAACDVVYFDMFERIVLTTDIIRPVYPKDPTAPLCGCFGLTCEDVEDDIAEESVARVKALLTRAQSSEASCRTHSVNGKSCMEAVQK
ncbi:MAG: hypothetical protein JWM11_6246 [Planctomycetaceae bacterium]|nr:hypothetical protein [Planctomycetaceae bacterium]